MNACRRQTAARYFLKDFPHLLSRPFPLHRSAKTRQDICLYVDPPTWLGPGFEPLKKTRQDICLYVDPPTWLGRFRTS